MSLPLLYHETQGIRCAQCKSPSLLSNFSLIYHGFWHYHNPPKNSNYTLAHITLSLLSWLQMLALCYSMSTCYMFHVTCYTNSLLSCIHIYTTYLLNIMCTLVATSFILIRLECIHHSRRMYGIYLYIRLVGLKNTRILTNYAQNLPGHRHGRPN
jgi:hypothetical protein